MEVVKKTGDWSIIKKRNGRYGVQTPKGKWINAEEKVKILTAEGLVTVAAPKAAPLEEATEESAE